MTKEELKLALDMIEKEAHNKRVALYKKYAAENAIAKIGDIVTDGKNILKVEIIRYSCSADSICYSGTLLKKDLSERKKHETFSVWERPTFKILKKAGG